MWTSDTYVDLGISITNEDIRGKLYAMSKNSLLEGIDDVLIKVVNDAYNTNYINCSKKEIDQDLVKLLIDAVSKNIINIHTFAFCDFGTICNIDELFFQHFRETNDLLLAPDSDEIDVLIQKKEQKNTIQIREIFQQYTLKANECQSLKNLKTHKHCKTAEIFEMWRKL